MHLTFVKVLLSIISPEVDVHKFILAYGRSSNHFTFLFSLISAYGKVYLSRALPIMLNTISGSMFLTCHIMFVFFNYWCRLLRRLKI